MTTKIRTRMLIVSVILIVSLACNFPGIAPQSEIPIATEPAPSDSPPDVPPDTGGDALETQPPSSEILPSPGLPTITLQSGSGWVFSTQQNSTPGGGDYDVWWNNAEVVGLTNHSYIVSLGILENLSEVAEINTLKMIPGALVPTPGEGFALKIEKSEGFEYALVRVLRFEEPNLIIIEYIFPYQGVVIDNP